MVKIEIRKEEIAAFDKAFKDIKTDIQTGFYLSSLRIRIQQELIKEEKKKEIETAKRILNVEKENSR